MTFSLSEIFKPTILLALALMAIIVMMILPMPAWVLDIGLATSFALAILMFTVTLFIERPLDFSAFPTVLLASLMLRLSMNVSSTKLIIGQGHTGTSAAGDVIEGFANFVMGGSVFLGLVVFCVLLIVNFIVITKGATRMAEVGARFALDGMPGKQLAIDSDMSAGAIDHAEAKARREKEQAETTFFGSLDGASKFVKGDAIAGLLITLLNIVMGLVIGVAIHGMDLGRAFETYAILTVGDGLVSQIPAVIISIASALLLARGGATGSTDLALFSQLGGYPAALGTVAVLMALFALVPGLPFLPFVSGAIALGIAAWLAHRKQLEKAQKIQSEEVLEADEKKEESIGDILDLDDIHVAFAPDLIPMVLDPATGLDARINNMRSHVAGAFGLILPEIRLTDDGSLQPGGYVIKIQGVIQAVDRLEMDRVLMILSGTEIDLPDGDDVREPVYGAPARWVNADDQEDAALQGGTIVSPTEVLATHLLEVIKRNFPRLLTLKALRRLMDEFVNLSDPVRAEANRRLLDELVPEKVPLDLLLSVLRLLLEERVSIRNLPLILESIAEARPMLPTPESICEHVRHRLGFQLVSELKRPDGTIPLVQLAPEWEERFSTYQIESDRGPQDVALPPDEFNRLATSIADRIAKAGETGIYPALVTSTRRRRFLKTVMVAKGIANPVLSFEEIGTEARPSLVGMVPV
ncbi:MULTISPECIES: flagellar biosynthesis protein FlhA [unclassified Aliiroseovarius]|uniref:flagellar biosynthesis protein FlhA n=1 Tax=unclassified Aliiroseovarius TaxID=2623558 RepID=UPI001569629A|nr:MULTISPECIES: flagellar biosynthesis protein FlhA [unclassified Aliiroseovarius]NRP31408.1 Flagellar biosynthesis protein FlhA [Aliiroseovarius sp. xm-m-314]NRP45358.1 Flagellar biosynthesis protein FlhA [Aliiroseovarius sp. xm-m-378]NRP66228.1 Flagellar biosynthesis protein FlhA [Aliiroseovarius sp. xm-v-225]NRP81050.1 Flagellar biosynthesis protein FlhA [Aliiroseovarius sp. xm-v-209]NRP93252.1 Flagellar biosynthesis protein FlhA [Aliiroseovarius sp. xm-a-134]